MSHSWWCKCTRVQNKRIVPNMKTPLAHHGASLLPGCWQHCQPKREVVPASGSKVVFCSFANIQYQLKASSSISITPWCLHHSLFCTIVILRHDSVCKSLQLAIVCLSIKWVSAYNCKMRCIIHRSVLPNHTDNVCSIPVKYYVKLNKYGLKTKILL